MKCFILGSLQKLTFVNKINNLKILVTEPKINHASLPLLPSFPSLFPPLC